MRVYSFVLWIILAFQTLFLEAQNSHICRISERTQDFIGDGLVPLKYDVIMHEVNVYSNFTDSLLFDIVFDAYNWSCGENIMIELYDRDNKLVYSDRKDREQLKNIYLSSFQLKKELLVIRLDFMPEKYRRIIFNPDDEQSYKIKLSASVKGLDKWVTLYGDSELDKRFLFFTPMYADGN
jgi:hypothetical protein